MQSAEADSAFGFSGTSSPGGSSGYFDIGTDKYPGPDPEGFSLADQALAFITGEMHSVIGRRLDINKFRVIAGGTYAASYNGSSMTQSVMRTGKGSYGSNAIGGWTQVLGLTSSGNRRSVIGDGDGIFDGAMMGFDMPLSDNTMAGTFIGGSVAEVGSFNDSHDHDAKSFYAGVYASHETKGYFFDLAIAGGRTNHDNTRFVDGSKFDARASYDGYFVSPALTVSTFTQIGKRVVIPSVRVQYAGYFFDKYTENGASGTLTVNDRESHVFNTRAQLTVPYETALFDTGLLRVQGRSGFDARVNLSGDTVTSNLNGQPVSFQSEDQNGILGFFLGADFMLALDGGWSLYGGFEGAVYSSEALNAGGQIGARFSF
ncbi:MAG: autotransporter outer membrane beta-barrel domain-containing protein [Hyphomicrobiales bacterium]